VVDDAFRCCGGGIEGAVRVRVALGHDSPQQRPQVLQGVRYGGDQFVTRLMVTD
jgi:hypothetical protein